jgi:hypothetical protein
MSPLRTAVLVVLFTLAALSSVATFVESYNLGEGLWAGHQFAFEGDSSPSSVLNVRAMFVHEPLMSRAGPARCHPNEPLAVWV